MSFQRAEDSKQPDVKLQNGGDIFWILLFYKKLNPTQKWPFLSKTTQPLSSRVGEPFSWKAICLVAPGWSGLSGGEVTGHMLRLVLAGGLSADPSDHYLGQVLNLLEIIWQKSLHTFHWHFCFRRGMPPLALRLSLWFMVELKPDYTTRGEESYTQPAFMHNHSVTGMSLEIKINQVWTNWLLRLICFECIQTQNPCSLSSNTLWLQSQQSSLPESMTERCAAWQQDINWRY